MTDTDRSQPDSHGRLSATPRTTHRRLREQGRTSRADLMAVLRAGFIAHLGVPVRSGVMVVPTTYGFDDEHVYVHGSVASRSLAATRLLALPLAEASVKVRSGPPDDASSPDARAGRWAGELPLDTRWLPPLADPALPEGSQPPAHIADRVGRPAHLH